MKTAEEKPADKISALRTHMDSHNIDAYLIPRADEYLGEFVAAYAERLKWLTGFTGSAGIAIVTREKAVVMSDARYTLQLDQQVDLNVFETADSIKAKPIDWLKGAMGKGTVGFDPYLHTPAEIEKLEEAGFTAKPIADNLIDAIWDDQPAKPSGAVTLFEEAIAGTSASFKLERLKQELEEQNAEKILIALPDSIAWILNVRGQDIDYIPSPQARLIVPAKGKALLFMDEAKFSDEVKTALEGDVEFYPESAIMEHLSGAVMMDFKRTPIAFKTEQAIDVKDPTIAPKAIKSPSEIEAIRHSHILDGVAVTKFLHWLEVNAPGRLSEKDAEDKILELRAQHAAFKGPSFPTIAGFGSNGAIIHYRADDKTNAPLKEGSLLLVDSGGQYYAPDQTIAGTTDMTRTIAIGVPSKEMIRHYTLVLKGHIALANAKFPAHATGAQVDVFARKALWEQGLDYAHGTGHGVGCFAAVHEEATSLSWRGNEPFQPGMLLSNEPGYYQEGAYGIRIENLVLVKEPDENGMLSFETIGYAPFDHRLIDHSLLDDAEKRWLQDYNKTLQDLILPTLTGDIAKWFENQVGQKF